MCTLCGSLGGPAQWTDDPFDAAVRNRLAAQILDGRGLALRSWQGGSYIVARQDGPSELAPSLAALWAVVERASGKPCDPLDPLLLAALDEVPS